MKLYALLARSLIVALAVPFLTTQAAETATTPPPPALSPITDGSTNGDVTSQVPTSSPPQPTPPPTPTTTPRQPMEILPLQPTHTPSLPSPSPPISSHEGNVPESPQPTRGQSTDGDHDHDRPIDHHRPVATPRPTDRGQDPEDSPSPPAGRPMGHQPPSPATATPSRPQDGASPSPTTASPAASDEEDRQASTAPAPTSSSPLSPSANANGDQDGSSSSSTPPPKRYQRGDQVMVIQKDLGNGTLVDIEVIVSAANAPALVVRKANTLSATSGANGGAAFADASPFYRLGGHVVSMLALGSLLLLTISYFAALAPSLTQPQPHKSMSHLYLQPNQWELLVFITYIQAMASTAHYVLQTVPGALWTFVDGFSWTVFIPIHQTGSGISGTGSTTSGTTTRRSRRLVEVVVLDGLVAFADRVGVKEVDLLQTTVAGFLVVCGVLVGIAIVAFCLKRSRGNEPNNNDAAGLLPHDEDKLGSHTGVRQRPLLVVYGLVVILSVFALYPLALMATFEIVSQVRASQLSLSSLVVAIMMLVCVCGPLLLRSVCVFGAIQDENDYKRRRHLRAVWGSLCSSDHIKYEKRIKFIASWLVMQVASAVVVASVLSGVWQIALLLSIDGVFLFVTLVTRPFASDSQVAMVFTCVIALIKVANTALATSFSSDSAVNGFIVVNSLLLVGWFMRHVGMAVHLIREVAQSRQELLARHATELSPVSNGSSLYASALYVIIPTPRDGDTGARQAML